MITARGVLVSSSSSFRLFLPSPPLPPPSNETNERVHDLESNRSSRLSPSCHPLVFRASARLRLDDALEDPFPADHRMWVSFIEKGVWEREREREGEIRSILLVEGERGLYTPFLLIFSRSNSNKWNYGWRRNFQRLSRIRKFPRIMPGHSPDIGDKAFASADIFTGPDSNKTASREFSPPSRRFSRCFGNASFFFPSSSFWNCYSLLIFLNAQLLWSRWRLQQPSNRYRNREKSWERGILCDRIVIITRINEVCWVEKWIYS